MDTLTPKNITALKNFAVIVKTRLTNAVDTNADYHTCGKLVEMNGKTKRCTGWMGEHGCYYCDHTGFECQCGNPIDKDEDFCSGYCSWAYWNCR